MKKKTRIKLIVLFLVVLLLTGCTKPLTNSKKKAVRNPETGQNLTANILCQPTNKTAIKTYEKYGIKIDELPKCEDYKVTSGKYEGLWTSLFIKPLAFILIRLGLKVKNYAISLIIISLIIRLIAFPITRKTALQSELMKKVQPELEKLQKKYKDKTDQESMFKQNQEMMMIYKKYNVSPMSGCLFAMLQLPLFIAFLEAVQRTPALFEDKFLKLQLGTTPGIGIGTSGWYAYLILVILVGFTTFYSFKMNSAANMSDPNMKMMPVFMTGMIIFTSVLMPSALGIYWITSNLFTIAQNILIKRSREVNGEKRIYRKN